MNTIRITNMDLSHLDAVYEIEKQSFSDAWHKSYFHREIMENKLAIYKVALVKPRDEPPLSPGFRVAGYVGLRHVINEGQIINIAVGIPYRCMGVGSLLIEALINLAQEREMMGLTLEVRESNNAAQGLYKKYGFKPEGIRKNYYASPATPGGISGVGEDAVIMWKYF